MIYELRTYWAVPGKLAVLHERFRTLMLPLFEECQIHLLGLWTPSSGVSESGDIIYLVWFPSEDHRQNAWDAFRQNPKWIEGKAQSEKNGPLVERFTSQLLTPISYGPFAWQSFV